MRRTDRGKLVLYRTYVVKERRKVWRKERVNYFNVKRIGGRFFCVHISH